MQVLNGRLYGQSDYLIYKPHEYKCHQNSLLTTSKSKNVIIFGSSRSKLPQRRLVILPNINFWFAPNALESRCSNNEEIELEVWNKYARLVSNRKLNFQIETTGSSRPNAIMVWPAIYFRTLFLWRFCSLIEPPNYDSIWVYLCYAKVSKVNNVLLSRRSWRKLKSVWLCRWVYFGKNYAKS